MNSRVGRIVQYEFDALTPEHRAEIAGYRRRIERVMQDVLSAGVADGVFEVVDIPGTTRAILSLSIDLVRWFSPHGSHSADDIAQLHADLAVRMTAPAGSLTMLSRTMTVHDSVVVDADPMTVYRLVADPSQMPRWSPENTGADVPEPGSPATVGTTFVGTNKRGPARWQTRCRVTASDPGSASPSTCSSSARAS